MISGEADESSNISKASSSSTTASWSRLKDPRIVRVSRALGGKDRHSKVCTVRGLRDRRVRLSVPTAIQLYDLQERLGLNQPSKVVDWLLDAAKNEIDELPPLQIPQGISFTQMVTNQQQEYNHSSLLSRQWDPSISLGLNPHPPPHPPHHHHHHQQQQQQQQMQQEDLHNLSGFYQITQPYFTSNAVSFDHNTAPIRPIFNFNMTADEQSKRGNDLHSS